MEIETNNYSDSKIFNYKYLSNKNKIKAHNNRLRFMASVLRMKFDKEPIETPDDYLMYKCFVTANGYYNKYITCNEQDILVNIMKVEMDSVFDIINDITDTLILIEHIMPRIKLFETEIAKFIQSEGVFTKWSYDLYSCFNQIVNSKRLDNVITILINARDKGEDWTSEIIKSCFGYSKIIGILCKLHSDLTKSIVGKYVISAIDICEQIAIVQSKKFRWRQNLDTCSHPINKISMNDVKRSWRPDSTMLFRKVTINDEIFKGDQTDPNDFFSSLLEKLDLNDENNIDLLTKDDNDNNRSELDNKSALDLLKLTSINCMLAANDYMRRLYPSLFPGFQNFSQYMFKDAGRTKCDIVRNDDYEYVKQKRKGEIYLINPRVCILRMNIMWETRLSETDDSLVGQNNYCMGLLKIAKIQVKSRSMRDVVQVLSILEEPSRITDPPVGIEFR